MAPSRAKRLLRQKSYVDEAEMDGHEDQKEKLWCLMNTYLPCDVLSLQKSVIQHVEYTLARRRYKRDCGTFFQATAHSVRDRLIERWTDTQQYLAAKDSKRVYYLSLEYMIGRTLKNAMSCLGIRNEYTEALGELGYELEELADEERDPGLGSGGLGRLASCFLDSLATLNYAAWGYGIRYSYGMFEQRIAAKSQVEFPDFWLTKGYPWEVDRADVQYPVKMYGHVDPEAANFNANLNHKHEDTGSSYDFDEETVQDKDSVWKGGEVVLAEGYDVPVPGFRTWNTNNMRLWTSKASCEFDLMSFNAGQYYAAIGEKERSEPLTSVLYPCDNNAPGKELRLRQQYFFVSATLQDIVRRFKKKPRSLLEIPNKVAIQLNDTHPAIAIPELMRLLIDEEHLAWEGAWKVVTNTCAYTNHTIMPEALELWPVPMMKHILPRHLQIIYEINHRFLKEVRTKFKDDPERVSRMSIIEEGEPKHVRMAHLAIVGCHKVNGVAKIHSSLLCRRLFPDFHQMWPDKFVSITNGVNHRRWMLQANPAMSAVLSKWTGGTDWIDDLAKLTQLRDFVDSKELQRDWQEAKMYNKALLARFIGEACNISVDSNACFDVHVKRIHEYKRQLMNILSVVYRYLRILSLTSSQNKKALSEICPRVVVFAGKAAPRYFMAKAIIKLILSVQEVVNNDPEIGNLLKVVFIPNYNVSLAELIIPASDVSQHVSTAGMEASGTSNMKFAMNGCLLVGSKDGANLEIAGEIGESNMFMFGANAEEVETLQQTIHYRKPLQVDGRLSFALDSIRKGRFGWPDDGSFQVILDSLEPDKDRFMVGHDFGSYLEVNEAIDRLYFDREEWTKKSILSCAHMEFFSSDRCIREYAQKIWKMEPHQFRPNDLSRC
mmetsp:Transcript_7254/g.18584  ORF Transcript_7254/g.18584 Transcript_7254/m.18584 type:complete len:887 (+) Transcript_7254:87-2747(+)